MRVKVSLHLDILSENDIAEEILGSSDMTIFQKNSHKYQQATI